MKHVKKRVRETREEKRKLQTSSHDRDWSLPTSFQGFDESMTLGYYVVTQMGCRMVMMTKRA